MINSSKEEKKCGNDGKTMWCYCGKCKQEDYPLPKDFEAVKSMGSSPSWEEKEREAWKESEKVAYLLKCPEMIDESDMMGIADYWIGRLKAAREEAYHQGCHESDTKVTEQFNRGLKYENSELVKIIREAGRSQALSEVKEMIEKELDFDYSEGDTVATKLKNHKELGYKKGLRFALSSLQQLVDKK